MSKKADALETIIDPFYWRLLPEGQRRKMQAELEDRLEAALDEGEPVVADEKFWNGVRERFLKNIEALEVAKKKMPRANVDERRSEKEKDS
jgi:predicted kinase